MAENKTVQKTKSSRVATARTKVTEKAGAVKGGGVRQVSGFANFIREQGIIGLAVGLAIGTAAGATVKTLVEGFINPVVQFIVGTPSALSTAVWHVELWGRKADFAWGAFVSSAITLVATAFVIYLIIHYAGLDRLDKKKQ